MAEFKKLSEVELVETSSDNATVLVEESGEIKRVPKKEVGGGAGGYVVTLTEDNYTVIGYDYTCLDNYDPILNTILAGGSVWIDWSNVKGSPYIALAVNCSLTSDGLILRDFEWKSLTFPNSSHNLSSMDE